LVRELKDLKDLRLPEISDRLEESRDEDVTEDNFDLSRILEEKESLEKRIREIEHILEIAQVIEDKNFCSPDKVELGSVVKIKQGKKILDVKLVSTIEADPLKNYISEDSPLGIALMNAKMGETIDVLIRDTKTKYKILEIC
jgi:transcription elongation factor GreA